MNMTCAKGFKAFLVMGRSSSPIVSILVVHFLAFQIVAQRMIQTAVVTRDGLTSVADFKNISLGLRGCRHGYLAVVTTADC
jgi:hypothetical protein